MWCIQARLPAQSSADGYRLDQGYKQEISNIACILSFPFNLLLFPLALHVKLLSHYSWAFPCLPQPVPTKNFNYCKCICSIGVILIGMISHYLCPACLAADLDSLTYQSLLLLCRTLHSYPWRMMNDKWSRDNLQETFPRVLCNTYLWAGDIRSHRSMKRWWFLNHWELELLDREI